MMTLAAEPLPMLEDLRAPTAKDDRCGCGCLIVTRESRRFTLPLRAVSFAARVAERVAEVTVEQTFENHFAELLEAVYIFPLPAGAAVSRFELQVDGKTLVGIVEERGEARRQYSEALAQGKKAALLEQERDDVFTVKVGNLPPRSIATIKMVYSERLPAFDDGETELRIPLVVAPRYIPGQPLERPSLGDGTESDSTSVPDASRISPPRLAPGLRGDVKLGIAVTLLGADAVDELGCTQHATKLAGSSGELTIALARKDELLDRDFVLRWRTAAKEEKPVLLVAKKGAECFGLLSLVPPRDVKEGQGARDIVFLLDRSGSMAGAKMDSAKRAVARLMTTLQPHDRFALCVFSDRPKWFMDGFMLAERPGIREALEWLGQRGAAGGTELDAALGECLALFEGASNVLPAGGMKKVKPQVARLPVLVLVTDGEVGNESEILRRIEGRLASVRVFTLGIDTAVNAAFLRRLAQLGRGTASFCAPGDDLEAALGRIGKEIGTPVLLDVEVEDRGLGFDQGSVTPERLPDLFAGRTASIFFKCRTASGAIRVRARRAEGGVFEQLVKAETVDMAALSQLWAKSRVSDLEDRYRLAYGGAGGGLEAARAEILGIALEHQLLTRFTAFLVVDHDEAEKRLAKRRIVQAVETPAGWADKSEEAPQILARRVSAKQSASGALPSLGAAKSQRTPPPAPAAPAARRAPRDDDSREFDVMPLDLGEGAPAPGSAGGKGGGPVAARESANDVVFDSLGGDAFTESLSLDDPFGGAPVAPGSAMGRGDPFAAPAGPSADPFADPMGGPGEPFAPTAGPFGGDPFGGDPFGGDPFAAPAASAPAPGSFGAPPPVDDLDAQLVELGADDEEPPEQVRLKASGAAPALDDVSRSRRDAGDEMAPPPPPPPPPPSKRAGKPRPTETTASDRLGKRERKAPQPARSERLASRAPSGPRALATVVDELGKELAALVAALERDEWPRDAGARLGVLREECILALRASKIAHVATRTAELLGPTFAGLLTALQRRHGKPRDLVHAFRAASEALAAQCRSELAPLLGTGGSPWEATI